MAWWASAKRGDKVVCVKQARDWSNGPPLIGDPVLVGKVYEIMDVMPVTGGISNVALYFGHNDSDGTELWYEAATFKPVQPKSTEEGMKMIRKLLDSAPVEEDA